MLGVHWRLAELWVIQQRRTLTSSEQQEITLCLQLNANFARKLAELNNWSYVASLINNAEWQHEICRQIEDLESQYHISGSSQ